MVMFSTAIALYLQNDEKKNVRLTKIAGILMELGLPSQVFITFIYWTALHHHVVETMKAENNNDPIVYFIFVFVHIFPFVAICVHIYISKIKFIKSHKSYMLVTGIAYLAVNLFGTKVRGEPIYPFLDWKDYKSPLIGGVLVATGYYTFDFFCNKVNSIGRSTT